MRSDEPILLEDWVEDIKYMWRVPHIWAHDAHKEKSENHGSSVNKTTENKMRQQMYGVLLRKEIILNLYHTLIWLLVT